MPLSGDAGISREGLGKRWNGRLITNADSRQRHLKNQSNVPVLATALGTTQSPERIALNMGRAE